MVVCAIRLHHWDMQDDRGRVLTLRAIAGAIGLLGAVVLVGGWIFDTADLRTLGASVPMQPFTALMFLLACAALLAHERPVHAKWGRVLGIMIAAIGASFITEYIFHSTFFDRLLFPDLAVAVWPMRPGRVAPNTAVCMVALGIALTRVNYAGRRRLGSAEWLSLLVLLIALQAVLGYLFGVERLYRLSTLSPMALNTAVGILLCAIGVLVARREGGVVQQLVAPTAAGRLARRLLPVTVLAPIVVGWVLMQGAHAGFYSSAAALPLLALLSAAVLAVAMWARIRDVERTESSLMRAKEAAEAANIAKGQFLAVVSHELRTPLNAVLGYADLLETEVVAPLHPSQQTPLQRIRVSTQHLMDIIEEILTHTSVERGELRLERTRFDAGVLAAECAALLEPPARQKSLTLRCSVSGALTVYVDRTRLRQVLLNLLHNAIKFTPTGGIEVMAQVVDGHARIAVSDTGPGIPSAEQERIFLPFVQLDSTRTRTTGGVGLGLSVAYELTQLMGGQLTLQSASGRGSTFIVELPLAIEATSDLMQPA